MLGALDGPAINAAVIVPNDTVDIQTTRAIYVGGTGDINVQFNTEGGNTSNVILIDVPVGTVVPVRASRVLDTGTSATNLVAFY